GLRHRRGPRHALHREYSAGYTILTDRRLESRHPHDSPGDLCRSVGPQSQPDRPAQSAAALLRLLRVAPQSRHQGWPGRYRAELLLLAQRADERWLDLGCRPGVPLSHRYGYDVGRGEIWPGAHSDPAQAGERVDLWHAVQPHLVGRGEWQP